MSTGTRKPPLTSNLNRRSQTSTASSAASARRSPTPSSLPAGPPTNGHARPASPAAISRRNTIHRRDSSVSSPLSARAAVKTRPDSSDESELETAAILDDLRGRLAKSESAAEAAAEEYRKQIKALQLRLEQSDKEQHKQEEALHAKEDVIETLEMQVKELMRGKRDQENIFEAERIAAQQEKEELLDREAELTAIIQRLKENRSQRERNSMAERRTSYDSSNEDGENVRFAPANHSPSPAPNNLIIQKDKIIESLRLELAEAQIRLAEADHLGGTKLQQLEAQLLDARMTNARLVEDNESFQLLLSTAAMNGDYPRGDYMHAFSDHDSETESEPKKVPGSPRQPLGIGSNLAEELEEADKEESDRIRKLEAEIKSLKETNKAMSLYISGIIERILQHKDSEAILDKSQSVPANDKPPVPEPKEEQPVGFLQRTKSLITPKAPVRRPEPILDTNPPLTRSQSVRGPGGGGHKRSQSDVSSINSVYRNDGFITPRAGTFYGGQSGEHYTRSNRRTRDSTISIDSGVSDIDSHVGSIPSPSRQQHERYRPEPRTFGTVAGGNKLRPLTLVQNNVNNGTMSPTLGGGKFLGDWADDGREKANKQGKRTSWMGWFNRGTANPDDRPVTTDVVFEGKDVD
ncbi:hypothetical protein EX30DRAFT_340637 [Ascodesmis nigricans]|uniref:M protein, serotype 2.1 n=1 Tax=Ascodesmis nigricans TaxID=341454 RepID=A0A4S2MXC7_9PEZI|nr:hypothetical protein EX30DRAFT_340637 [Ascodesmis nigricans]